MPERLQKRGNRWWFRCRIPTDLVNHYGRKELVRNLHTSDRTEATRQCRILSAEVDGEFARIRAERTNADRVLPPEELRNLADLYLASRLREDDTIRIHGLTEEQLEQNTDQLQEDLDEAREALARGDFSFVEPLLVDFLSERSRHIPSSSPSWRALLFEVAKADVRAQEIMQRRDKGEVIDTPDVSPMVPASPLKPSSRHPSATLDTLLDYWQTRAQPADRSLLEARTALKRFREIHGDIPAPEVRKGHMTALRDALVERGLAKETIRKSLNLLGAMFALALDDEQLGITINPAAGIKVRAGKDSKVRAQWTVDALNKLFASPVFTEDYRPEGGKGAAAYFVPLICLFTGGRLGEVTGLSVEDIREADGVTYFDFTQRRLKTESSLRRVPVHPALVALGLLRYAGTIGSGPLFPGCVARTFTKWFGRYLDSIGVTEPTAHGFRHLIKSQFRLLGFPEDVGDALVGHVNGSIGRAYGSAAGFPLAPLADWMRRLRFDNLKLPPPWEPAAPSRSHRAKPSARRPAST
jgi:integrase